jgi:PQQ-like domain
MARRRREGGLVAPLSVGNAANVQLWGRAVGGHPRIQAKHVAVLGGVVIAIAATLGLAGPASAQYASTPAPLAWRADGPVHAVALAGDRVYVGGQFSGGIAALDASTGALLWSATTDGDVRALTLSDDGSRLFAGGAFVTVNGQTHRHLVALSTADGSLIPGWRASASGMVRDLVVYGDVLYAGGLFKTFGGVAQRGLGAVNATTGKRVASFTDFVDKSVYGLAVSGSTLVVSGRFTLVDNTPRQSLAAFDLTTGALTSWAPARVCSTCSTYWDVAVDATNAYVASSGPGGQMAAYNLVSGRQPWHYVHSDGDVQAVAVGDDGLVYVGGHFGRYVGGVTNVRSLLAAVNRTTGLTDPNFAPKLYTSYPGVWALAASPSTLYAGGNFTGVQGANGYNNHVPYFAAFSE